MTLCGISVPGAKQVPRRLVGPACYAPRRAAPP
jgi:hypothetical protein